VCQLLETSPQGIAQLHPTESQIMSSMMQHMCDYPVVQSTSFTDIQTAISQCKELQPVLADFKACSLALCSVQLLGVLAQLILRLTGRLSGLGCFSLHAKAAWSLFNNCIASDKQPC